MTDVLCMNGFQSMDDNELMMVDGGFSWKAFGGCAAVGAVGGLMLGIKAGAAGGTVVAPIVGTVTGAVAGGIMGAIEGALVGAAGYCVSEIIQAL